MAVMPINEIKCPVDIKDFPQYADGFAQYEKIVAIQAPLVYDQCLLKKCLMDKNDPRLKLIPPICPPTQSTVSGLNTTNIPNPQNKPLNFREFRNFTASITNISATQISATQNLVTVTYKISFIADILVGDENISRPIELMGLTESVTLNCPASQLSVSTGQSSTEKPIFKLEVLPDLTASSAYFSSNQNKVDVYFTLCYTLVIKCELDVQMLIPFYGFFEDGRQCSNGSTPVCPCDQCVNKPTSELYPPIDFSVFNCGNSTTSAQDNNIKPSSSEIVPTK